MGTIDWDIVKTIAGMGYLLTFIVVGIVSLAVWLTGLIIMKSARAITEEKPEENGHGE